MFWINGALPSRYCTPDVFDHQQIVTKHWSKQDRLLLIEERPGFIVLSDFASESHEDSDDESLTSNDYITGSAQA